MFNRKILQSTLLTLLLVSVMVESISQNLTNTTSSDGSNIIHHAISELLTTSDSLLTDKVIILEGQSINTIGDIGGYEIINSGKTLVYWTESRKLNKDFKYLIGRDIVRLIIRNVYVERSMVHVRVLKGN